ncbi:hypothetical protein FRC01_007765 [Tulasnella sp. 417]|nr:hypothetical protein FRC01_007765 [Tulasnella sp. 417]
MARSGGMNNDHWDTPQPSGLFDLPVELLKQVISCLPVYSQASFIVNRFIRPICEECLYETITLVAYPRRSLHLLETFVVRPDLALLVHSLSINAGDVREYEGSCRSLGGVAFDGATALSLAKNLRYLSISIWGSVNWLRERGHPSLRRVIFNFKLRGLRLPPIFDWTTFNNIRADFGLEGRSEDMVHDIRSLLQAQPRLEYLNLVYCRVSDEVLAILKANLSSSDVPSLKSLEADQYLAIPFMAAASGLQTLKLYMNGKWDDNLFSQLESISFKSQFSLRRLVIWSPDEWPLENFARVFALFPRMEELKLGISAFLKRPDLRPAEYYFNAVGV